MPRGRRQVGRTSLDLVFAIILLLVFDFIVLVIEIWLDPLRVVVCRAQQVVSELPGYAWDIQRILRAPDLVRWRSCVDLRSEALVFKEIVCRSQEDSRWALWIRGGVDLVRNSS